MSCDLTSPSVTVIHLRKGNTTMTTTTVPEPTSTLQDLYGDRFQQAVMQAAATMDKPEYNGRLQKAMDFVLSNAVILCEDGTATVKSGSHTYHLAPDCNCEDARRNGRHCKHFLAVELMKCTHIRLGSMQGSNGKSSGQEQSAQQPPSQSAAWSVHEAPASCCLKFQMNGIEIMYTMRDCNDDLLYARVRRILPKIMEKTASKDGTEQPPANETHQCSKHNVPMKQYTKNGRTWFSHKTADGQWCRG